MSIFRYFRLLIFTYCLLSISVSVLAQEPEINILNLEELSDVIGDDFVAQWSSISPTGSVVVWATWTSETKLCQYQLETKIQQCLDYRAEGFGSYIRSYTWSPDGNYIAFTETINDRGFDSDLWVYDLNLHQIVNLTDDGVGQFYEEQTQRMIWDVVPTWNPITGDLYFFRVEVTTDWERTPPIKYVSQELLKIDLADRNIEEVRDLSQDLIIGGTLQHPPMVNFEGNAAISSMVVI